MLRCSWYLPTKELSPVSTLAQRCIFSFKWYQVSIHYTHLAVQKSQETVKSKTDRLWNSSKKKMYGPLPSLQRPKSAIFTKPSVSSNKLSNFKSLNEHLRTKLHHWCFFSTIQNSWNSPAGNGSVTAYLYTILCSCRYWSPRTTQAA